eukprot:TRINITY_DN43194_c0_g1_i1.p1 TRINITY_DN43194_c0_g1~~TRINITY_DN43194_c0_g1_i1.p1  ORF type:complete len:359 (-),score=47.11 TRINITY_DN43194_c0_g1_i1:57-1133(-)
MRAVCFHNALSLSLFLTFFEKFARCVRFSDKEEPASLLQGGFSRAGAARGCGSHKYDGVTGELNLNLHSTWNAATLAEKRWTMLEPMPRPAGQPHLALLMLTSGYLPNEHMWVAWMDEARSKGLDFEFYLHAFGLKESGKFPQRRLARFWVKKRLHTNWCDVRYPLLHMMGEALKNPNMTHVVVTSENTVPLKPLSHIYKALAKDGSTRMCMDFNSGPRSPRAESWWVAQRNDVSLFVDHSKLVLKSFSDKLACPDEEAWLRLLLLRHSKWRNLSALRDECVMFTDWTGSCKEWKDHGKLIDRRHLATEPHTGPGPAHPICWSHIGQATWHDLSVNSPFWFGRKFTNGSFDSLVKPFG